MNHDKIESMHFNSLTTRASKLAEEMARITEWEAAGKFLRISHILADEGCNWQALDAAARFAFDIAMGAQQSHAQNIAADFRQELIRMRERQWRTHPAMIAEQA